MGERIQETTQEKGHRQLMELLQELRVAVVGVQVLFAFLLTVPFAQGWARVTDFQQDVYFAALLFSAAATACLIAPSAIHRIDFERGDKPLIVQISDKLMIAGLGFLSVAIVAVVCLITDYIFGGSAVVGFTVGTALVFSALWYVLPLFLRLRK